MLAHEIFSSYNCLMFHHTRFFLAILFIHLLVLPAFSLGGALADSSSPLHVIQTQYFDIIFPEESRPAADKIAAVCDDYYLQITSLLETDAYQRFPVTITSSVEMLNAYYTAVPYNRIVLYDTTPDESLDMYEDTIQSVFYHELTHAVTYNMKGPVLRKLSFFADALTPAWLSVTTFWAEGATVSFESKGRGGRLNDPFSTQIVNQSVIEGHFPSWRDVTGARDTYPGGTDGYMFGSMFAAYLQETYGMSKYAEFWKTANSRFTFSFIAGVFERTYGKSISDVWDEFEKTLTVDSAEKSAELLSHKKSLVSSFDIRLDSETGEKKIAYYDRLSSSLRLLTINKDGKKKNKKLLAITGITSLRFSSDGERLLMSRYIDKRNYKKVSAAYEFKSKKYTESKPLPKNAAVFDDSELIFSKIEISGNLFAAIVKDGLSWHIKIFDSEKTLADYDFSSLKSADSERNLILHNLHFVSEDSDSLALSFSWAELGMGGKMLSRPGFFKINREDGSATAYLHKENSFAGVIDSFPIFDDEGISLYSVFAEYEKNPLYRLEMNQEDFETVQILAKKIEKSFTEETASEKKQVEISYNPFRYYPRGILIPGLSFVPVFNHDLETDSTALLGATFVSTNPWGDKQVSFSAGYAPIYNNGGAKLSLSGGDDSFQYTLSGTCLFDKDGFMQTADTALFTKTLWRGKVSSFAAGTQGSFLYGRQIINEDFEDNWDESDGKSADALAFVQFSNIHKIAPGVYSRAGFLLQPFVHGSYRTSEFLQKFSIEDKYLNAGVKTQLCFPVFFPFIFTASLFPSSKYAANGSVKAILFDLEIHKGIPAVSLFAQRLVLSTTYSGKIAYRYRDYDELWNIRYTDEIFKNVEKEDYSDALTFRADLYLSPNTGFIADGSFQFSLGYAMIFRPNPKSSEKKIAYGITFGMAY